MAGGSAYPSPEEAALAEWDRYPNVEVWVVRVELNDADHATVITDTVPSHPMHNYCTRTADGWVYVGDSN
jgi:hypothetical protein